MLDKSPIPEPLKETLLFLFGLPLGKLQEEVSKTPQTVKVGKMSKFLMGREESLLISPIQKLAL